MNPVNSPSFLIFFLSSWIFLPSLFNVTFSLSSHAVGIFAVSAVFLSFSILKNRVLSKRKIFGYITAVCGVSALVGAVLSQNGIAGKPLLSMLLIWASGLAVSNCMRAGARDILKACKVIYSVFVMIVLVDTFFSLCPGSYRELNRPLFPFSEPSHFAIAYGPFACAALLGSSKKLRLFVVLFSVATAIKTPNLTLAITSIILACIGIEARCLFVLGVLAGFAASILILQSSPLVHYIAQRVNPEDNDNLSRLVYLQGWESVWSCFHSRTWMGLGFQNLGTELPGPSALRIQDLTGYYLNRHDGSFLASKVLCEFGVFGILIVSYVSITAMRSVRAMRRRILSMNHSDSASLLPLCFCCPVIVELFVRSTGYFSPTLILFVFFLPKALKLLVHESRVWNKKILTFHIA